MGPRDGGVPGSAGDLTGEVRFNGPNAVAEYGVRPSIYTPLPFSLGKSISHWEGLDGIAVMQPYMSPGWKLRMFARVEEGALRDIGYTVNNLGFIFTEVPFGTWKQEGDSLELRVAVERTTGTVVYQWMKDGANLAGETLSTYTVSFLIVSDTGWYTCRVSDALHTKDSPATLVTVVPLSTPLPASGIVGLCIVVVACVLAGAFVIMRRV